MSNVIRLLPDSVANQIAAGEVIQRPASVIKELVENAVDAGATSIKIILRDGGKNLIQVIDNGCGMSDTDARMAFERHATSKITAATDLFDLHTMGFRGEALPSIAAVAQVEVRTMQPGAPIGTHLCISGSKYESQVPDACPCGTNMAIKNLFFNIPARRKFLKKDSVELSHIVHEFERLALVNPDKEFLLVHNDVTLHQLMPGTLKQRIVELFGKALDRQLLPVATETSLVKISGFISTPENARKRNPLQFFFVNGRNMRHPYFQKAVMHCFEELIPSDHQPNFFLNFEVDASTIDVNIHPTKNEIKFENEAPIWQILVAAIKEALGKFNAVPSIDFSDDAIDLPAFNPTAAASFGEAQDADYNPFAQTEGAEPASGTTMGSRMNHPNAAANLANWEKLYEGFTQEEGRTASAMNATPEDLYLSALQTDVAQPDNFQLRGPEQGSHQMESAISADTLPGTDSPCEAATGFLSIAQKYVMLSGHEGLIIIDRHRAHLKVLYERFIKYSPTALAESQQLLFPETLTLTAAQQVVFETIASELGTLGFDVSYLGDNVWAINASPAALNKLNPVETLLSIVEDLREGTVTEISGLHKQVALAMARTAAVRQGQMLTKGETEKLLSDLFSLPDPHYTPDGHKVMVLMNTERIASLLS